MAHTPHKPLLLLISRKKKDVSPFRERKFILALKFKTNFRILTEEKQSLGGRINVFKNRFMAKRWSLSGRLTLKMKGIKKKKLGM